MHNYCEPALDLPPHLLDRTLAFGSALEKMTIAKLVLLVGQLERTRQSAQKMLVSVSEAEGLDDNFIEGANGLASHAACLFELVEAELERRFSCGCKSQGDME